MEQRMTRGRARIAIAALLASVAARALATSTATASADATSGAQLPTDQTKSNDEAIYITAPPLFHDVQPERSLDQDAIDSYGASTVDEILGDLQVELGEDAEQPLLIVNGHRVSDLSDIGALPVEVLRNIVVLPRGAALRAGGTGTQRVISITLKRSLRQATVTAAHKISTDGNWNGERGEAMLTHVKGDTRANLTFRMRDETPLLESQRGIIQPSPFFPYAISGNIIGFPDTSGEIDPALSALAGQPVFVVPLPASAPTLQQLAGLANQQNATDLGAFRTLRPKTRNYDLNGTFATRLAPWLTANATLHWYRNDGDYLRGLPGALFVLSRSNPFSPFSNSVGVAVYGKRPLHSISTQKAADANATFNANWGLWQGNLNLRRSQSTFDFNSQRATAFGPIPLDDSLDPFATDLSNLIALRTDSTSSRSTDTLADLTLNGPAFHLPAGDVTAVIEGRVEANHLHSTSTFVGSGDQRFHRNSQSFRGGIDIPLTSRENAFLPEAGELSASIELSRAHFSDAGSINHATYGLTWEPAPPVRFHGSIDRTDLPAPIQTLGNPVTITPQVRVFDPLTGETVDVTEITGGIPSLRPQSTKTRDVSALLRLVPKMSLELNAEYIDTDVRNFVSSLPQASAAVELAFPQRFIRDANGVLTTIDLRPVNFDSHRDKRLRWGLSMNTKIGAGVFGGPTSPGMPRPAYRPPTYLQLTFNHTMVFSDQIVIRPGLDSVDLLRGGAMGIGGGRVRHQIDSTMAVTSGGLGVRMGVTWRAASELVSQFGGVTDTLHFSPLLAINLKAFTDVKRLLPHDRWAKGLRLSVDVINALNRRQTVHDSFGSTPLQYQPAYRDPLGRTVEIELRKVF
jgi:iron complex outermembrane receptor protein